MIKCKICNKAFKYQITNSHLKTHNFTTEQYKLTFNIDTLISPILKVKLKQRKIRKNWRHSKKTKKLISSKLKNKIPWNKGKTYKIKNKINKQKLKKSTIERYDNFLKLANCSLLSSYSDNKIFIKCNKCHLEFYISKNKLQKHNFKKDMCKNCRPKKTMSKESIRKMIDSKKNKLYKIQIESRKRYDKFLNLANCSLIGSYQNHFLKLKCNKCDSYFTITRQKLQKDKFRKDLCQTCRTTISHSQNELKLFKLVKEILPNYEIRLGDRSQLNSPFSKSGKLEIDIYIPKLKIGIEYCGLFWHSEKAGKDHKYHLLKYDLCKKKNIDLITIFEDEYISNQTIIENLIKNKLTNKINLKNIKIKKVDSKLASSFLFKNHLNGECKNAISYGIFHNEILLSIMSFLKHKEDWEITRTCTIKNISNYQKLLLLKFIKDYNPKKIIVKVDKRFGKQDFYLNVGFKKKINIDPKKWYIVNKNLKRSSVIRSNNKIWDCGYILYEYDNIIHF